MQRLVCRTALVLLTASCSGAIEPPGSVEGPGPETMMPRPSRPGTGGTTGTPGSGGGGGSSTGTPGTQTPTAACRPGPVRMWRLTPDQMTSAARALWGGQVTLGQRLAPFAPKTDRYSNEANHLQGSAPYFAELFTAATELAAEGSKKPEQLHPCLPAGLSDDACIDQMITSLGRRAFRRPLTDTEKASYRKFFGEEATAHGRQAAVEQVLRRFLLAPSFTFRTELGTLDGSNLVRLSAHEAADAVSFLLTDGPPDPQLQAAADDGSLLKPGELAKHARRLLSRPETSPGLLKFISEMAHAPNAAVMERAALSNPAGVLGAMPQESSRFATEVLWKEDARLQTLLSAPFTVVDKTLATHYGLPAPASGFARVPLTGERKGLLTQGAIMTTFGAISNRGAYVRDFLLCQPTPPPPIMVDTDLAAQAEAKKRQGLPVSRKQIREQHLSDPACAGCHKLIDPVGMPFDMFDDTGRIRTVAEGEPVYRDGALTGTDVDGTVSGPGQLIDRLARSSTVQDCFVQELYQYVHGRGIVEGDGCYLDRLRGAFRESGGNIRQLVEAIVAADNFIARTPFQEKK